METIFFSVNDSMVSLGIPRFQWHRWIRFPCIETKESFTKMSKSDPAVSLKPGDPNFSKFSRFSRRIQSHMRYDFRPWIRALWGIVWWKKSEGRKSRDTVPLKNIKVQSIQRWNFNSYVNIHSIGTEKRTRENNISNGSITVIFINCNIYNLSR
jgi:hypothetical protein